MKTQTTSVERMPAGKYWIGDLCYVIGDSWDAFCSMTIHKDNGCLYGKFPWKTGSLWQHGTYYGDGTYYDQDGNEYGVDAGLIGCIPVELCDNVDETLGHVVDFATSFACQYSDGLFTIGHISIHTNPPYDDEDEDSDHYGDHED